MMNGSGKENKFENFGDFIYKYPCLVDQIAIIEISLSLFKFNDLTKCNKAATTLNKFFEGGIVNAVMFQHQKPDTEDAIKGTFLASLPLSEKNYNLFLDLLVLNLISANTIAFDNTIIIRIETKMYEITQSITIDH